MRVAILGLILVGCGSGAQQAQDLGAYSSYVQGFQALATSHAKVIDVSHLVIKVQELSNSDGNSETISSKVFGECQTDGVSPTVMLSPEATAWDKASLTALIYHELGHCLLGRTHLTGADSSGLPLSLMNPNGLDGTTFTTYQDRYISELFK